LTAINTPVGTSTQIQMLAMFITIVFSHRKRKQMPTNLSTGSAFHALSYR